MFYCDSPITVSTTTVSTTVEEQAFSLPRHAVGPALRYKTKGLQRVCEN